MERETAVVRKRLVRLATAVEQGDIVSERCSRSVPYCHAIALLLCTVLYCFLQRDLVARGCHRTPACLSSRCIQWSQLS